MHNPLKYFIYARKSSEPDEKQMLSIQSQLFETQEKIITPLGVEIVDTITESHSAKAPGRPAFDHMIERIKAGEANGIIAWHPNRLSRNSIDAGQLIYMLDTKELLDLKFCSYTFENTPEGKFFLNMMFTQGKYDVDKLSVDVLRGFRTKLRDKGQLITRAPIGYLNAGTEKGNKHAIVDPERFPVIRRLWDLMLSGNHSVGDIVDIANNEWGFLTRKTKKRGGSPLAEGTLNKMFHNAFYCGLLTYNGQEYSGTHTPMVTKEEFNHVQDLLHGRSSPRRQKHVYALTGLIRCKECGSMFTASPRRNRHGKLYDHYHCTRKNKAVECHQSVLQKHILETQIINELKTLTFDQEWLDWAINEIEHRKPQEEAQIDSTEASMQKKLEALESEKRNYVRMKAKEQISEEDFVSEVNRVTKELDQIKSKQQTKKRPWEETLELSAKTFNFSFYASLWFLNGINNDKRAIFNAIGLNPQIFNKELDFEVKEPFYTFKTGLERIKRFEPLGSGVIPNKKDAEASLYQLWGD